MDFVADALFDGGKLRDLTVVDNYARASLAADVGQSLKDEDVVVTLDRITATRGLPALIKVYDGSDFISKVMDRWAYERGVELDFSRPVKPTDNAKIESFNGRLRQECLNLHWLLSIDDVRTKSKRGCSTLDAPIICIAVGESGALRAPGLGKSFIGGATGVRNFY